MLLDTMLVSILPKSLAETLILGVAERSRSVRRIASFIVERTGGETRDTYAYLKRRFIEIGDGTRIEPEARRAMVDRFEIIDNEVPMGSTPTDGLILAQLSIASQGEGDFVECGCYAGGSSAKLSIVAKALGKKVHIFDSFEGLPEVDHYNLKDHHARRGKAWVTDWTAGRYAARIDDVKASVEKFGEIAVCSFIKGWFSETMTAANMPRNVCFAFTDVDIASSARDCILGIWPRLSDQGIFVSHDAAYIKVLQTFHNEAMWRDIFHSFPPMFFGAGFGICDSSPHIGYFVKGIDLDPGYLKGLTIDQ
jgi:O-methyltransferase